MILLVIPFALGSLAALLFVTEALERRSSDAFMRMALRSKRTPEATEVVVAAELARRLQAAGLGHRPVRAVAADAHVAPAVVEAVMAVTEDDTGEIDVLALDLEPEGRLRPDPVP